MVKVLRTSSSSKFEYLKLPYNYSSSDDSKTLPCGTGYKDSSSICR